MSALRIQLKLVQRPLLERRARPISCVLRVSKIDSVLMRPGVMRSLMAATLNDAIGRPVGSLKCRPMALTPAFTRFLIKV